MSVLDKFSLKNKVAVVTGGEGLLGRMICETIRELDGTAYSLDLKSTADHVLNICDAAAIAKLSADMPPVDIIVNNAVGNQQPVKDAGMGFGDDLNVMLVGAFNVTASFGSRMEKGVILNIGSDLGLIGPDPSLYPQGMMKPASYSVGKHGVIGMTRYFACFWGGKVRVNCLCPGGVDQGQKVPYSPMARLARLDELAGPVAFMVSEASSFMTGAVVSVDGGRTCF